MFEQTCGCHQKASSDSGCQSSVWNLLHPSAPIKRATQQPFRRPSYTSCLKSQANGKPARAQAAKKTHGSSQILNSAPRQKSLFMDFRPGSEVNVNRKNPTTSNPQGPHLDRRLDCIMLLLNELAEASTPKSISYGQSDPQK